MQNKHCNVDVDCTAAVDCSLHWSYNRIKYVLVLVCTILCKREISLDVGGSLFEICYAKKSKFGRDFLYIRPSPSFH